MEQRAMRKHLRVSGFRREFLSKLTAAIAVGGALVTGCAGGGRVETVSPSAVVISSRSRTLTVSGNSSINGTYTSCTTHDDGDPWIVNIGGAPVTDLEVVKGNTACVLTVTSLTIDGTEYVAGTPIVLDDSYGASSSEFHVAASPIAFYANAKLSAKTFLADFAIDVVYSDDPDTETASKNADYAVQTATATATLVPAPDYTIDMTSLTVQTNNAKVVQTAAGTADLTDVLVTGEAYVVLTDPSDLAGTTYAEIDAAYLAAGAPTAIAGADPTIPAAAFGLGAVDLSSPATRYVIVSHSVEDVRSYQLFTITFNSP